MCRFFSERLVGLLVFMYVCSSIVFLLSLGRRAAFSQWKAYWNFISKIDLFLALRIVEIVEIALISSYVI